MPSADKPGQTLAAGLGNLQKAQEAAKTLAAQLAAERAPKPAGG